MTNHVADTNVGKMTEEEAITHLETVINWNEDISVPEIEAVKLAIEALQKQIPMKPIQIMNDAGTPLYHCPTCGYVVYRGVRWCWDGGYVVYRGVRWCWECGQKISDWRNEE